MSAFRFFVALLGALGILFCVASCLAVWYAQSKIDLARQQVFAAVDQSLTGIDRRLVEIQNLAARSKITVHEIQERTQDWTKQAVGDRLATRIDLKARVQQLAAGLRQAELLVELSGDTVQQVRQALELGAELGLGLNADAVDPLVERIAEIQADVSSAIAAAESLGQRFGEGGDDESGGRLTEQAATIAARLLATFGRVDTRLAAYRDRLTEAQHAIEQLSAKTRTRIVAVAIVATLFLLWMAAGQWCLWRWARNCRGTTSQTAAAGVAAGRSRLH